MITISCPIKSSARIADRFYASLLEHTPMLQSREVEFFFLANDPTDELLVHLSAQRMPFRLNKNKPVTEYDMARWGYSQPIVCHYVYKAFNVIIQLSIDLTLITSSGTIFSDGWLESLLDCYDDKRIVTPTVVEPTRVLNGQGPHKFKGFGKTLDTFDEAAFQAYVAKTRRKECTGKFDKWRPFAPCLVSRKTAEQAGMYPEGNLGTVGKYDQKVRRNGDGAFYSALGDLGVAHIISLDSIVYHFPNLERYEIRDG